MMWVMIVPVVIVLLVVLAFYVGIIYATGYEGPFGH